MQQIPRIHEQGAQRFSSRCRRAFSLLDLPPALDGLFRGACRRRPKNMRVAADHLAPRPRQHRAQRPPALALRDQRKKEHRIQHVTQLVQEGLAPAALRGFEDFPGFFDEVGQQRGGGLRPIPGAAARGLEPFGGRHEIPKRILRRLSSSCLTHAKTCVMIKLFGPVGKPFCAQPTRYN